MDLAGSGPRTIKRALGLVGTFWIESL